MSLRIEKINSLIEQTISQILLKELSLKPGVFITVAKVDTTPDMRYTRIFLSVFPITEKDYVESTLKKELFRIQGQLNRTMKVKIVPKIQFLLEDKQEKISQLDALFEEMKREEKD